MAYQPIEDYGLIGNMQTAALVSRSGSIDWLCMPHFDSPSIFAAILDDQRGGNFQIAPLDENASRKQVYWPDTNVLITRFLMDNGVVEVIDYMPVGVKRDYPGFRQLIRRVELIRGEAPVRVVCRPAFNYARDSHTISLTENGASFESATTRFELVTQVPLSLAADRLGVESVVALRQGERAHFAFRLLDQKHAGGLVLTDEMEQRLFENTVEFWHRWIAQSTYTGRWREMVSRSALALKLLTFDPTGALVAAPTTSLPEAIPGPRNWDYRYTWIRDSSFSLYALLRLGFTHEAMAFTDWLEQRCRERIMNAEGKPPSYNGGLQIMYGLHGESHLPESTLDHLDGYRGARPVRLGNGASDQLQLDIYGEFMDSVHLHTRYGYALSWDMWQNLCALVDWVCDNWHRPDEGIWETRGGRQHFVYSKVMCWVAVDRGIKLAQQRSLPANWAKWIDCRDRIYRDVMEHGYSTKRQAFIQSYGNELLDASTLLLPMVHFISPGDPRMISTLKAICRDPRDGGLLSNGLVYRYNTEDFKDGLAGGEGTFNMCTFWLVEALALAAPTERRFLYQARLIFEKMLGYANHLGLYAEETGMRGEALGNFPQAFTHLALISAAVNLDKALTDPHPKPAW